MLDTNALGKCPGTNVVVRLNELYLSKNTSSFTARGDHSQFAMLDLLNPGFSFYLP